MQNFRSLASISSQGRHFLELKSSKEEGGKNWLKPPLSCIKIFVSTRGTRIQHYLVVKHLKNCKIAKKQSKMVISASVSVSKIFHYFGQFSMFLGVSTPQNTISQFPLLRQKILCMTRGFFYQFFPPSSLLDFNSKKWRP